MRSKAPVFAAAAWFAATAPVGVTASAAGAPRLLEEVVVTGTKLEGVFGEKSGIPLRKMPQSVQIISSQEIAEQGARSIGDRFKDVWIDAYVANLFDEEYFTASGNRFNVLSGDPRTFGMRVGMSW